MCISPKNILIQRGPFVDRVEAPCGRCWQCRQNKVSDLVGRGVCETISSRWAVFLNLTYRDHADHHHQFLVKKDFQQFIREMRRATWAAKTEHAEISRNIRYLVAGEYGSLRGRAHFHCVLWGTGMRPRIPQKERAWIDQWPHGHVFADWDVNHVNLGYVAKYALKEVGKNGDSWVSWSKYPILGREFVITAAARQAVAKVMPRGLNYSVGDGKNYVWTGAAEYLFLDTLYSLWPDALELEKTSWIEGATRRWYKKRVQKLYDDLPQDEQRVALEEHWENSYRPKFVGPERTLQDIAKEMYFGQFSGKVSQWLAKLQNKRWVDLLADEEDASTPHAAIVELLMTSRARASLLSRKQWDEFH